ncbi:MAG: heme ABC transporter ATP-binding protein [Pseudonocardiaceae bacterium]|nr:heme ABC transporter ATP-binding protein [Pseudonocardiaceae bacterium]
MNVDLQRVSVRIAGEYLVRDLSLHVAAGEVVGLVGPNGCGKSTTLGCVYRTLRPAAGAVLLDGEDLRTVSLRHSARQLAALTQDGHVEFDFTVSEVVAMGRLPHQHALGRHDEHDRAICDRALHRVDAAHLARRSYLTLSGGEKQRVQIARALAQQPRVLVLDEPTNHLDVRHQLEMLSLVRRLGITVLMALHDLNLAAAWCHRLYVLDGGHIVASGPPTDVLTPELLTGVFGVRAHIVSHPATGAPQLLFDSPADAVAQPAAAAAQ